MSDLYGYEEALVNATSAEHERRTREGRAVLVVAIIAALCGCSGYVLASLLGAG